MSNQFPDPESSPSNSGVRRHHTITASSRSSRPVRDTISEEGQDESLWNDDEPVDRNWAGAVGAVGEKSSLHRQASLPTKYHRGYQASSASGTIASKAINSLAAIAGHEGDEEPWNVTSSYSVDNETSPNHPQFVDVDADARDDPISPLPGSSIEIPSPSPAANIRRHVSLTYGADASASRKMNPAHLKRSGTLQTPGSVIAQVASSSSTTENPEEEDNGSHDAGPAAYNDAQQNTLQCQQLVPNSVNRQYLWSPVNDWCSTGVLDVSTKGGDHSGAAEVDDVQRALSILELASTRQGGQIHLQPPPCNSSSFSSAQGPQPPRFNPPPSLTPGRRTASGNGYSSVSNDPGSNTLLQSQAGLFFQPTYLQDDRNSPLSRTWTGGMDHELLKPSSPNLQNCNQLSAKTSTSSIASTVPRRYVQHQARMAGGSPFQSHDQQGNSPHGAEQPFVSVPVDVPTLIAAKGYNPQNFDVHPQFARYFVIKSYTEDDVHKSLKYEIWSSTDFGNKRLDKAFRDTAGRGPIYLFFSVNGSGHFCGMAKMLTPVDYSKSSTVWASDKWKGVFSVEWIFVRDIPNATLRHIKLYNTQEKKPVTNSRDTQELLPDAGQEMLRIFHVHLARTSLLQDFAFYELQSIQKLQSQPGYIANSQSQELNSQHRSEPQSQHSIPQQSTFGVGSDLDSINYAMPRTSPMMMQMQTDLGIGLGMVVVGAQYTVPQNQSVPQTALSQSNSAAQSLGSRGYMGL